MPKPKATEVIVHRVDLQPSLKESLDSFLIGKTLTNTLQGIGSIVNGLGPALGVIAGWYLADRAIDEVVDTLTGWATRTGQKIVDERYRSEGDKYMFICAMLESSVDLPAFQAQEEHTQEVLNEGESNFQPVAREYANFKRSLMLELVASARTGAGSPKTDPAKAQAAGVPWEGWGQPLARRWKSFYHLSALTAEVKADALSLAGQADKLPWPISWGWKKLTNQ